MSYILCSLISIGSHGLIRAPRPNIAHEHRPVEENDDDDDDGYDDDHDGYDEDHDGYDEDHDGYNKKENDDDGDGNVIDM